MDIFQLFRMISNILIPILLFVGLKINLSEAVDIKYQNYNQTTELLKKYALDYPKQTYLYSIGKSVEGNHQNLVIYLLKKIEKF